MTTDCGHLTNDESEIEHQGSSSTIPGRIDIKLTASVRE